MRPNVQMAFVVLGLFVSTFGVACTPAPIYTSIRKGESEKRRSETEKVTGDFKTSSQSITSKDKRDAMMEEIETWMGTPYGFGMVEKGKGTDCSGFVGSVFRKVLAMELPRQAGDMYVLGRPVTIEELQFADLVFFQNTYKGSTGASHVGIYVGDGSFAHASTTVGVTISRLNEAYYQKHFLGCRRIL